MSDTEIQLNNLLQKIRDEFPDLRWQKSVYIDSGKVNHAVILDDSLIFRFPREKECEEFLNLEIELLAILKSYISIPIPHYAYVAKDRSFAGYDFIQGESLTKEMLNNLIISEQEKISDDLATFLSELHNIPTDKVSHLNIRKDMWNEKNLLSLENQVHEYLQPRLSKEEISKIEKHLEISKKLLVDKINPVLVHQDIYGRNILIKDGRVSGIIDFNQPSIADPAQDFEGLIEFGEKFVENIFEKYQDHKDKNFLLRVRLYFERMALWTMVGSLQGYTGTFEDGYDMFKDRFNKYL